MYDFNNLTTPAKTYNYSYLADANYTNRGILNRVSQVTVTAGGTMTTLVTNTYDNYPQACAGAMGLTERTGSGLGWQHDDANYGTGFVYRGNVTYSSSLGGAGCTGYESTGVAVRWEDAAGHLLNAAPSADTSYSLPGSLTPQGNAQLATTVSYTSSWQVTSVSGPNGAQGKTTYDPQGRPQKTKIPDGAETNYTYTYVPNTQTATLGSGAGARFKKTTLDGFGRVIRVETGHDSTTVSQVDTQYAACACSPLGKLWRTSAPYAPGGTPQWTTYAYDGSGRTVSVTAPDGSVTTTLYMSIYGTRSNYGNFVRVTDPAGKWKVQQTDAMGNLVKVYEPNPAGGADLVTVYTYNGLGQMTDVSMTRSTGTQTRHFVYTGKDLTSATNPENGTVTYEYDVSHRVTKRTDALGQQTRYVYDSLGRMSQVQHWKNVQNPSTGVWSMQEMPLQRVTYHYDNPLDANYSHNTLGRLAAVEFFEENVGMGFTYLYSYNQAGRVTAQRMTYGSMDPFDANYTWDTEGRMTGIGYGPSYTLQYDGNGRLSGMQESGTTVASASYDAGTGLMTGMSYFGFGETRQYNALLQMTQQTVTNAGTTVMDMQYNFTAGSNNGRITSAVDSLNGETVSYAYDALNRLSSARTGAWGQGFEYDGFGNLTTKTALLGSVPVLSVSFDAATNHQWGVSYDLNGNVTGYGVTYDVENRMITDAASAYSYDHAGKRVYKGATVGGTYELYFYGIGGQKLVTATCTPGCARSNNVYFGGKLVKSKGVVVATDRLGSVRANSNAETMRYYPYGEERTTTPPDNREKFGTYTRDSPTQDYADQRYYNPVMGRFTAADPYEASAGPGDPGSWNRYTYTRGDPINRYDPDGLKDYWFGVYYNPPELGAKDGNGGGGSGAGSNDMEVIHDSGKDGGGDGGGGGVMVYPIDKYQWFAAGFDDAWMTLSQASADCIKDIGGVGATSASVRQRLMETKYYVGDLGIGNNGSIMVAGTFSPTEVVLNGNAFLSPTQTPNINSSGNATTVNLLQQEASAMGLDYSKLSIADWQAATLLHELGHELGGLADDTNSLPQGVANSQLIWNDCFPGLKRH